MVTIKSAVRSGARRHTLKKAVGAGARRHTRVNFWNPKKLKHNCVFVTMAYLYSPNLSKRRKWFRKRRSCKDVAKIIKSVPMSTNRGVQREEIYGMLKELGRKEGSRTTSVDNCTWEEHISVNRLVELLKEHPEIGVGYISEGVSRGHCVVASPCVQDKYYPRGFKLMCYQTYERGRDLTHAPVYESKYPFRYAFWFN